MMALDIQPSLNATEIIFLHIIPRGVSLAVWALSLNIIVQKTGSLRFGAVQGLLRAYPVASTGVVLAHLSTAGFPLLAGFPPRLALWEGLASQSLLMAFWLLLGVLGLLVGVIRTLAVLAMAPEQTGWSWNETVTQGILLAIGMAALFFLGVFPQFLRPFLVNLPQMFSHLTQ
jgi:formate hydrogenlyase subunit 3/multisubunit Na+/H+ antiporter MnhD subunit